MPDQARAPPKLKEMKVLVPAHFVVALHSQKILTGEPIATILDRAVTRYLQRRVGLPELPLPAPSRP